uniref:Uncharacterized protein n=1 Tax=Arundo donax TaxID=35708 RepID=A0A0A9DKD2_ARUDO
MTRPHEQGIPQIVGNQESKIRGRESTTQSNPG